MALLVLCDPAYRNSVWCDRKLAGIRDESLRRRTPFRLYDDPAAFEAAAQKLDETSSVIVLFDNISYIQSIAPMFRRLRIHPILSSVDNSLRLPFAFSRAAWDVDASARITVDYMLACGRTKLALVGLNPNSHSDVGRADALRRYLSADKLRVCFADESMQTCFADFLATGGDCDAILCPNDHIAICLSETMKAAGIPPRFLISYGDTMMAQLYGDGITSLTTNHYGCGKSAVELHFSRLKNGWSSASLRLCVELRVRGSTENIPYTKGWSPLPLDLTPLRQPTLQHIPTDDVGRIDRLLAVGDLVDLKIIYGILCGYTYEQIGEFCFLSLEAAKYRVRRIRTAIAGRNKADVAGVIGAYVNRDRLRGVIESLEGN